MIDEEITFILFKYTSKNLSHSSGKKVLAVCNECGKERLIQYRAYRDLCISCVCQGDRNHNYGKHFTEETKSKISKNHADVSGENNPMFGRTGAKHPMFGKTGKNSIHWKGGAKMRIARKNTKRRELFGFIPHNLSHDNFHGHHLDFNHVIFIPAELHRSISHSVINNKNMDLINNMVCDWYLEYQRVKI